MVTDALRDTDALNLNGWNENLIFQVSVFVSVAFNNLYK